MEDYEKTLKAIWFMENMREDALDSKSEEKKQNENALAYDEQIEYMGIAIEALKKQYPNRLYFNKIRKYDGYNEGWCPNCSALINDSLIDVKYCWNCGQAFYWRTENEK